MKYISGISADIHFGGVGRKGDRGGVTLFGDIAHPAAGWAMEACGAEHPRHACLSENQMWSICFKFSSVRPYGDVLKQLDEVARLIKAAGWTPAKVIEGLPDTGSSVDDLADTRDYKFAGTPAEAFPEEPFVSGYNAAGGFSFIFEKVGTKPVFSKEDIAAIRQLAGAAMQIVFGRELPEMI